MLSGERIKAYGKQAAWVAAGTAAGATVGLFFSLRDKTISENALKARIACVENARATGSIFCPDIGVGYELSENDQTALSMSGYVDMVFENRDALAESVNSMIDSVESTEGQPNSFLDSELYGAALGFALSASVAVRKYLTEPMNKYLYLHRCSKA